VQDPRERLFANLNRPTIPGLDGVRACAALTVVISHAVTPRAPGQLAVQAFFVLSGLLITWLLLAERFRTGSINLRSFYTRRAFRLLPPLFVLLIWEVLVMRVPASSHGGLVAAGLYVANYYSAFGHDLAEVGHTWSLAIEEHFYLVWPLVIRSVASIRLEVVFIAAALSAIWKVNLWYGANAHAYAWNATETNATALLYGCGLAVWVARSHWTIPRFVFQPWLAAASLIAVLALGQTTGDTFFWAYFAATPLLCVILLQAVTYEWRVLENPVARYLGKISYSIYLWHLVAMTIVRATGLRYWPYRICMMALVLVMASASHCLIEQPCIKFGRKLARRR
jgi:peptidoglycan/LPS O-acetylase OafA/YrhL